MTVYVPVVKVISPPAVSKGVRAWKSAGGSLGQFLALIADAPHADLQSSVGWLHDEQLNAEHNNWENESR